MPWGGEGLAKGEGGAAAWAASDTGGKPGIGSHLSLTNHPGSEEKQNMK